MSIFHLRSLRVFYQELASLINSGISVVEAMQILSQHLAGAKLKAVAAKIRQDLVRGQSLDSSLSAFPELFPRWHVAIIHYSQASGRLGNGLERIVGYLEKDCDSQRKLILGLAYPVLLFHAAVVLLPIPTLVQGGWASYLYEVGKILLPLYCCIFVLGFIKKQLSLKFKAEYGRLLLAIPFFGKLIKNIYVTKFIRALGCLLGSGVGVVQAWPIAAAATDHAALESSLRRALPVIEAGGELVEAFARAQVFSPKLQGMIAAGEKGGSINVMLEKIAVYSEKENNMVVGLLLVVVPFLAYIGVAVYIAYRVIAFYSNYFSQLFSY